jgi:hypothetical protein
MIERVAVLLGTVQYRLKVKVVVPEKATLQDAEKAAWTKIADAPVSNWTLVDELGVAMLCRSHSTTFWKSVCRASRHPCPMTSGRKSFGRRRIEQPTTYAGWRSGGLSRTIPGRRGNGRGAAQRSHGCKPLPSTCTTQRTDR